METSVVSLQQIHMVWADFCHLACLGKVFKQVPGCTNCLPSGGENLQDQLNVSLIVSTDTPALGTRTVALASISDIFGLLNKSIAAQIKVQVPQYTKTTTNRANGGIDKNVLKKLYYLLYNLYSGNV